VLSSVTRDFSALAILQYVSNLACVNQLRVTINNNDDNERISFHREGLKCPIMLGKLQLNYVLSIGLTVVAFIGMLDLFFVRRFAFCTIAKFVICES